MRYIMTAMPEDKVIKLLRDAGHRVTPQRLIIGTTIMEAKGHISAASVLSSVRKKYPYVNVSTVYRTASVLKQYGLLSEADIGKGEVYYEWVDHDRHHHLICKNCGTAITLPSSYFDALSNKVSQSFNFQVEMDHLTIFGLCKDCRHARTAKQPDAPEKIIDAK